jgi:hypothetical protein
LCIKSATIAAFCGDWLARLEDESDRRAFANFEAGIDAELIGGRGVLLTLRCSKSTTTFLDVGEDHGEEKMHRELPGAG